jgi:hypothetical protein
MSVSAHHANISSFVTGARLSLPRGPVEIVSISFLSLTALPETAGIILAPSTPHVTNVDFVRLPRHIQRSRPILEFHVAVAEVERCSSMHALPVCQDLISASLASHLEIDVELVVPALSVWNHPAVEVSPDVSAFGATVSISLPPDLPVGSEVRFRRVTVAGESMSASALPAPVTTVAGVQAPMTLKTPSFGYNGESPSVSSSGLVVVPQYNCPANGGLLLFDCSRHVDSPEPLSVLTQHRHSIAAAVCDVSDTLLVANNVSRMIYALSVSSLLPRWEVECAAYGVAVLSAFGVVVAGDSYKAALRCFALRDGALLSSAAVEGPTAVVSAGPQLPTVLFVTHEVRFVKQFAWNGVALEPGPAVDAPCVTFNFRLLAVMPPAPGKRRSHLIVGTWGESDVIVMSLPDCIHVHTQLLSNCHVRGIAADPSGTALAVCDGASGETRLMAWPIEGMPELE